jgi:hypothetical protein
MKLWWPHNEAMIATLMAYEATGDETWWQRFEMVSRYFFRTPSFTATHANRVPSAPQVAAYTMEHFPDDRSDRKMPTPVSWQSGGPGRFLYSLRS